MLFVTHLLSCIIVGLLFRFWKFNDKEKIPYRAFTTSSKETVTFSNLGEVLATSITNSINTVVMIGGFVILFSVIISILNSSGVLNIASTTLYPIFNFLKIDVNYIKPIFSGIVELTNGLLQVISINTKSISTTIVITAMLLGFGGFSVLLQLLSITSKSDISIKPYAIGKLLHGIIAALLTYMVIHIFPIFNLDITPIFSQNVNRLNVIRSYTNPYNILLLVLIILFTSFILLKRRPHTYKKV